MSDKTLEHRINVLLLMAEELYIYKDERATELGDAIFEKALDLQERRCDIEGARSNIMLWMSVRAIPVVGLAHKPAKMKGEKEDEKFVVYVDGSFIGMCGM